MPLFSGDSARMPALKHATAETSGKRGSSRTMSRRPLASSNFWIVPAECAAASDAATASDPGGFSEVMVRLRSVRYVCKTRMMSAEVTLWSPAR